MAALAAGIPISVQGVVPESSVREFKVGNDIVYMGGLVSMLVSSGTGVILAGQDTDNHRCMGIALETVDGTGLDTPYCKVLTEGSVVLGTTGATSAMTGLVALISDDQTVLTTGPTHGIIVGIIEEVISATKVRVRLNPYHATA
jgi:hypothetical protein